ncbi:hypothetical protein MASR2M29_20920 [Spirochaetota bacterium]
MRKVMEPLQNEIKIAYADSMINELLHAIRETERNRSYNMHFNQGEEFFIELSSKIYVPKLPIHHDVKKAVPDADYISCLKDIIKQITGVIPECFHGLVYFFDPAEILKPSFYRLYKAENDIYLYILRLDLLARPFETETIEQGSNDLTSAYATQRLYMESELIPLDAVMSESGRIRAFRIKQLISQTWIGETGKGYMVSGVWMDNDLTKFFTKLFLTPGQRIYPYYPFFCKYKTICANAPILTSEGRRNLIPLLHRAIKFLAPEMDKIQNLFRNSSFSEKMPEFQDLKNRVPDQWLKALAGYSSKAYLNEHEQKEYILSYGKAPA